VDPSPNDDLMSAGLREHAIPIHRLEPGGESIDLQPLKHVLQDVKIVGLGESTHGTREFFQAKHRLVEFLVRELGFTAFTIEASHAACLPIDEFLRNGKGDRADVLSGQHYIPWDTEEFSSLLDWLRVHNEQVPEDRKVSFHGVDVTYNDRGHQAILAYLDKVAPNKVAAAAALFQVFAGVDAAWPRQVDEESEALARRHLPELDALVAWLEEHRDELVRRSSAAEFDRILLIAHILPQWWRGGGSERSRHMAANLLRLVEKAPPDTRFIYWGHNAHVGSGMDEDGGPRLGHVLRERLGDAWYACALEFGQGWYQTRSVTPEGLLRDLREAMIGPPPAGSLPWHLASTGIERFFVDLRAEPATAIVTRWLDTAQPAHGISWAYADPESTYTDVVPRQSYDGIVFIKSSTPARQTATARAMAASGEWL